MLLQPTVVNHALCLKERIHVFAIVLRTGLVLFQSAGVRTVTSSKPHLIADVDTLLHMEYIVIVVVILSISN